MIRSLHSAASGMSAQQLHIDVVANNLANVSSTGFKRGRAEFQDLFYQELRAATRDNEGQPGGAPAPLEVGQGVRPVATTKLFHQGAFVQTNAELDLAIEGEGFFRLRDSQDRVVYTRAGAFKLDADGQILNAEGLPLEPPIFIPPETTALTIERTGVVKALQPDDVEPLEVGVIELSSFVNAAGLKSLGHGLYAETEASGQPTDGRPGEEQLGLVSQGMLESSNVQVVEEMIDLIAAQRAYEINARVIRASDEMLQQAAALR